MRLPRVDSRHGPFQNQVLHRRFEGLFAANSRRRAFPLDNYSDWHEQDACPGPEGECDDEEVRSQTRNASPSLRAVSADRPPWRRRERGYRAEGQASSANTNAWRHIQGRRSYEEQVRPRVSALASRIIVYAKDYAHRFRRCRYPQWSS